MFKWVVILVAVGLGLATAGSAQLLRDGFIGNGLDARWAWANEDDCMGWVKDGLVLNPKSGNRQSAVGTSRPVYSWVPGGHTRTFQFTISQWDLVTNSHVSARMFLVGNGGGVQPEAFSDYNKPNVLMAKLDLWEGTYFWNLFVKTNAPSEQTDLDSHKICWVDAGSEAAGCTFGVSFDRDRVKLWWQDADGRKVESGEAVIPTEPFSRDGTFYVGVKNDTGGPFDATRTVTITKVSVTP
jgi:hypothetical protein